jgi:signal transduction histidine kinase
MRFCVVSNEIELPHQCRRILEGTGLEEWELIVCIRDSELPDADVYIWDFAFEPFTPSLHPDLIGRSLFLVELGQLDQFRQALGTLRASIVLKPVQPATLRPFLEHAFQKPRILGDGQPCREDRDDLLESVLHANLKLQEYDQSRTNFLARALHDFRAPLTALDGYCGLLIEQGKESFIQEHLSLLGRMKHSVERLSRLTDAMFELSVGQQSKRELDVKEGDVEALISQAIHEVTPHARGKRIRVGTSVTGPHQPFFFDAGKMEQVLINLLENACKFTSNNGTIEVSAYPVLWFGEPCGRSGNMTRFLSSSLQKHSSNAYRIDVRDSGCGIPGEHIHSIFEEYTSYAGGKDRSGGGLGLAICRLIVDAHLGAIWAESNATGTQFSLVLPYGGSVSAQRMGNKAAGAASTTRLSA